MLASVAQKCYIIYIQTEELKMTNYTKEQLENAGGKYWEMNGMERVYFNDLERFVGLSTARYSRSGNISSASLNGQSISNTKARDIEFQMSQGKIWYGINTNVFNSKNMHEDYADIIINEIVRIIEG